MLFQSKTAIQRVLRIAVPVAGAAILCVCLCGCLGFSQKKDIAAKVDGSVLYESEVTEYIEGFRAAEEQYETDSGWSQYLLSSGYTAASLRGYVINNIFIPKMVIRLECDSRGITVSSDELDKVIEEEKNTYQEHYGQDSWASVLTSYGYDEESWRQEEEDRILKERLIDEVIGEVTPSDSQVQAYISEHPTAYNGKHSYSLSFDSQAEAQTARDLLMANKTESDAVTFDEFTTIGYVTDSGWSSLQASSGTFSGTYQTALNTLQAGQVSKPVQKQDGDKWLLILCDQVFLVDEETFYLDLSQIPTAILQQFTADAAEQIKSDSFDEWLSSATASHSVVINEMPDGLSYDVKVSGTGE